VKKEVSSARLMSLRWVEDKLDLDTLSVSGKMPIKRNGRGRGNGRKFPNSHIIAISGGKGGVGKSVFCREPCICFSGIAPARAAD